MPARPSPRVAAAIVVALTVAAVLAFTLTTGSANPHGRGASSALPPTPSPPSTVATTLPPGPAVPRVSIAAENARAGTPGWTVHHPSTGGQLEAYADQVSARQGDTVRLFVSSPSGTWTATAYRMGWYGGVLARAVWRSARQPGVRQPLAAFTSSTGLIEAHWTASLSVPITSDWTPGDYLFTLVSSSGWDTYVPLTVRDDTSTAPILIVNAVTTWEAYNLWGGGDLYSLSASPRGAHPSRADVVSFDRPYRLGNGSGDFLGNEEKLVKLVESAGLDVAYTTDIDLATHPELLLHHAVVVSPGHDEYYSTAMRDALEAARDHGVNLVFLGGNAVYRHIRLQPSALGADREVVNYRVAALDPVRRTDPAEVTVSWRASPVNRPESTLLGEMYQCNPVRTDLVVTDPGAWIWAGSSIRMGQHLRGLVGSEYDHWDPSQRQPAGSGVELLAQSPLMCRGRSGIADVTYYVAPSGAGVIDTGTTGWIPMILDDPAVGATVAHVTLTMLREASLGPLGHTHPAAPSHARSGAKGGGPTPPTGD